MDDKYTEPGGSGSVEDLEDKTTWGRYLLEGETFYFPGYDDSSEWSDDSDSEEYDVPSAIVKKDEEPAAERRKTLSLESSNNVLQPTLLSYVSGRAWLKENVITQYWAGACVVAETNNDHRCTTLNTKWERYLEDSGIVFARSPSTTLSEYHIIREILWVLQGSEGSFVFAVDGRKCVIRENVRLSHLTNVSLSQILGDVATYASIILELRRFIDDVTRRSYMKGTSCIPVCQTYEAYATGISEYLQNFNGFLSSLEKTVQKQDSIHSLSTVMLSLIPRLDELSWIHKVHKESIGCLPTLVPSWERAVCLLNVLYCTCVDLDALGSGDQKNLQVILHLFLKTVRPYAYIIDSWTNYGLLEDKHNEFIIERKAGTVVQDTQYLDSAIQVKQYENGEMAKIIFLEPFMHQLLQAGKSMELLRCLRDSGKEISTGISNGDSTSSFYKLLLKNLIKELLKIVPEGNDENTQPEPKESDKTIDKNTLEEVVYHLRSITDYEPLLMVNFKSVVLSDYAESSSRVDEEEVLLNALTTPFPSQIQCSFHNAISPFFVDKYQSNCKTLLNVFRKDFSLMSYLSTVRMFFLMEAGDVMFNFYSSLFEKIRHNEFWQDSSMLTASLQDATSSQYPTLSEKMSVTFKSNPDVNWQSIEALEGIKLKLHVPWPVDIVITNDMQDVYNQIFTFLIQLKWAKYSVDILRFQDLQKGRKSVLVLSGRLARDDRYPPAIDSGETLNYQEQIQCMYRLRMKLLYFVNNVHNYIMTQVLHTTGIELERNLESASDLEQMSTAHANYVSHLHHCCLLKEKEMTYPRTAIKWILNLCIKFRNKWDNGLKNCSLEEVQNLESELNKCSQFLKSFHERMAKHGSFIDWLFTFVLQDWLEDSPSRTTFKKDTKP